MGIRARSGNDRLRTIWTPEMDRFFIDLLLDEVSKGNNFDDHLFSKRAWRYMTSLFNAKFKYQCEKDVLKNRHKTLRNLYRAVKKILDQKGFSWDEARQMIVADDGAWDEYIKMHPDRRAYRIKTIPYYHDLCLIYGDAAFEEKGHSVAESLLLPNEVEAIAATDSKDAVEEALGVLQEVTRVEDDPIAKELVVEEMQQETPNAMGNAVTNRSRTNWQPPMDRYFIDLMLEQLHKGNQIDGLFRKQAWMDMIASFNAKFGFDYDMDVLKNRYKTLKRQYKVIENLLELDGFGWDDARHMVTADDYVWQDYIKTHTDARQFMTRPVPYYKDLCLICSHQSIDRSDGFSSQYLYLQNDFEISGLLQSSQSPAASVSGEDKDDNPHIGSNTIDHRNKRKLESFSNSSPSKRSRGKEEGVATPSHQMAIAVPALPDERKDENSNSVSMENVIWAIQSLPDMDEDLVLDACDFLEDEMKAKTFMALNVKLRKKWLLRKLRPESRSL